MSETFAQLFEESIAKVDMSLGAIIKATVITIEVRIAIKATTTSISTSVRPVLY